jgi:hypothetical protein
MSLLNNINNNPIVAMPLLNVSVLNGSLINDFDGISTIMDQLPRHQLLNNSWPQYETKCSAGFSMAHTDEEILIKFYIVNDYFQSKVRNINEAVHQDNCIEFFVSFNGEQVYYNIEFNCLGIGKMAYGNQDGERKLLPKSAIRKIKTWTRSSIVNEVFDWEIILSIPATVFEYHQIKFQKQLSCKGNFYKCGDELPAPHYLTWNRIEASSPDFHRPEFFGDIVFEHQLLGDETLNNITKQVGLFFNR